MKTITVNNYEISIPETHTVLELYEEENGCCPDRPFVLTSNLCEISDERPSGINYSCQCACNTWCTTGFETPEEAVADYRRMVREAKYDEGESIL